MNRLDFILEELVTANRILANEGIVDSFGHVSARHPDNPQHYLLSRARAPERIERSDIVEYTLEGEAIDKKAPAPYMERFIHGAIYEARPEVQAVVHNLARQVRRYDIIGERYGNGPRPGAASWRAADDADARARRHRGRPLGPSRGVRFDLS